MNNELLNNILTFIYHYRFTLTGFANMLIVFLITSIYYRVKKKVLWIKYYKPYLSEKCEKQIDIYEKQINNRDLKIEKQHAVIIQLKIKLRASYQLQLKALNSLSYININKEAIEK